jgi:hypothetical protein
MAAAPKVRTGSTSPGNKLRCGPSIAEAALPAGVIAEACAPRPVLRSFPLGANHASELRVVPVTALTQIAEVGPRRSAGPGSPG